ncbi:MAG: bifunctional YncE family protein/alkaline phosphatase family protein [Armatimonadetes bacterium]|nr:bifunctional YncE family protein/alkaline phosphatase family protein [Armatimonadota bacterium]
MKTRRWVFVLLLAGVALSQGGRELVGHFTGGKLVTPTGQLVTPTGRQVDLPGTRPQAIALSPDGTLLATAGKSADLVLIDPATATVRSRVALPNDKLNDPNPAVASANILKPDTSGQLSYTGLVFSHDGKRLYLSNVNGSVKVFGVDKQDAKPLFTITIPEAKAPRRAAEIPAGLALTADDRTLYVCGNLGNRLHAVNAADGKLLRSWDVGAAPYDVVLAGGKAYVSNWGGRQAKAGELTGPAGRGTVVKVDPVRHIASEGSVSVVELSGDAPVRDIIVQLHSSALALSPDGRYLVCANAGSDNLSVIELRSEKVVETIWAKAKPSELLGATPCALAFSPDGRRLYAANGTQNAVAVIDFAPGKSQLRGLVPVGWFPGALAFDAGRRQLCVANIKGLPEEDRRSKSGGFNSHQYTGSVSLVPLPRDADLPALSETVYRGIRRERIAASAQAPRPNQPPRPVPERIGEPSLIKHVVYVIKENRTYDQVLGDVAAGNGSRELCNFGEEITPNQHKLVRDFVLLDNTYCCSILSADGHQWSTTAFGNDYLERSFAGWPRSYPDGMGVDENDALAYSSGGFLWDNAVAHQVSLWNFGEFAMPECGWRDKARKGSPRWRDYYDEFLKPTGQVAIGSQPSVETIRPFTPTDYVGWEMSVPDVWRAAYIKRQLAKWEAQGQMPSLIFICLPDDHTSGTGAGTPTPQAYVADNDLAFGQLVEAFGKSRFGRETLILGIEDDPQAGWDHVSGYRTTAYIAGPYVKRGAVVSTMYNTVSLIRTIEQILGLPPMNQFDAAATPMFDCFDPRVPWQPFTSVPNQVRLDWLNGEPKTIADAQLRRDAIASAKLDLRGPDRVPEDQLNRILWRATMGTRAPYPEWAVSRVVDDDD